MPYLPLPNFNHDSGPRRIQSGPDHEGYVVLYSGVESTGADDGFAVLGAPLSGTAALGAWDYDSNWRYVPSTLPGQSGSLDPTPYNVSGALDTYDATRIYTRDNVAGAQAASAIGPETGKVNPRGGALQARSDVTRPETYMYYGGAAPDNQDYSPYNTPDANSAAEGKTGGGVTHKAYESTLLTNVLGSQGTSDRSQWRYHQPVYCKTYTETRRSETPGLMSTPLRYVYRGSASSYNYNYAGELLANKGGFEPLKYDEFGGGCDVPPPCPTTTGDPLNPQPGDTLRGLSYCTYTSITWYNTGSSEPIGTGDTYTIQESDYFYKIYYVVTYPNGSTAASSQDCLGTVNVPGYGSFWVTRLGDSWQTATYNSLKPAVSVDKYGNSYLAWQRSETTSPSPDQNSYLYVRKANNKGEELWAKQYSVQSQFRNQYISVVIDPSNENVYVGWGGGYRNVDLNDPSSIVQPSCELLKINSITGDLIWYYYYLFTGDTLFTMIKNAFKRIYFDSYLNKIIVLYADQFAAYSFSVNPENPSDITSGTNITYSTTNAGDAIRDVMVVRSEVNPTNTFMFFVDNLSRYVLWKTDEYYKASLGASGTVYTGSSFISNPSVIRMQPTLVTISGQEYIISGHNEMNTPSLVLWNSNLTPVLKTSTTLGCPVGIQKNPNTSDSVYITFVNKPGITISGVSYKNFNDLTLVEYSASTNSISNCSLLAVVSGNQTSIADPFDLNGSYGITTNINKANRAVITYYRWNPTAYNVPSGINSLFVLGVPITASGSPKYLNWNNDAGYSGIIEATNNIYQTLGTQPLPSITKTFVNLGAGGSVPFRYGSGTPSIVDLTGSITTAYGYTSLD